jgi:ribosomal protein S18 acetylase RimI-like enzyme
LASAIDAVRVIGPEGEPSGLCICHGAELEQLFVSASARRSGVASALLVDAEFRMFARGIHTAWLACAIGNERAAECYVKRGWRRKGIMTSRLELEDGVLSLDVWRFEKTLSGDRLLPAFAALRDPIPMAHHARPRSHSLADFRVATCKTG